MSANIYLYVPNVAAVFDRAVAAGAQATMPVADMFWGDRFGVRWGIATHTEDVSPAGDRPPRRPGDGLSRRARKAGAATSRLRHV